jgi:MazG family protein
MSTPVGAEYVRFHRLARILRERCGWDIEQTHQSLRQHLIEETYEVIDAIDALDPDDPSTDQHLIEELGDLLYQIEFHATIAEQEGRFTIADIARGIHDKLVRRHPHVFGPEASEATEATDIGALAEQWEAIKAAEKLARGGDVAEVPSALDGVALSLPALSLARKIQSKAARVGFDWPDATSALPKIAEESEELVAAIEAGERYGVDSIEAEVGDLLFAMVNIARHLGIEPEVALRSTTLRFIDRFTEMERLAAAEQLGTLEGFDDAQLEALYQRAKANLARR